MLLLSGCSYTDNEDFPSIAFGRRVYNKSLCKILAWGGAGNHYIARSILDNITPDVDKVFSFRRQQGISSEHGEGIP